MTTNQPDMFGHAPPQGELFAGGVAVPNVPPVTPELVRGRMLAMLGQLRGSDVMPWPDRKLQLNEVIFPQMANWLPKEEAEQLCFEFRQEVERIKLAQAA